MISEGINRFQLLLIVLVEAALRWNFVFWSYFVVIFRVGVDVLYRRAIRMSGILPVRIFLSATCTLDEPDKHFSHKLLLYFAFFAKIYIFSRTLHHKIINFQHYFIMFYWWRKPEYQREHHRPVTSHWQTLSHNFVLHPYVRYLTCKNLSLSHVYFRWTWQAFLS
jgi:hypothetical protein